MNIINYDIVPELSEITDWRDADFDIVVANEVFYSFSADQLNDLLLEFREKNPDMKLIVGMSRQSFLNSMGKMILGYNDAHEGTLLGPKEELEIISKHMRRFKRKSVFYLMDVYGFVFK